MGVEAGLGGGSDVGERAETGWGGVVNPRTGVLMGDAIAVGTRALTQESEKPKPR